MTSGRRVAPLLGRAAELSRIHALLDEALAGRLRLLLCSGEAGIGKTALMRHFVDEAARRGAQVLWSHSFGSPGMPPFWLWRNALGLPDPVNELSADRLTLTERLADRLRRIAADRGVVLAIDDLDQADGPSLHTLLGVVRFLNSDRVLIYATCNDERAVPGDWQHVRTRLLAESATEAFLISGLIRDEARRHLERLSNRQMPESIADEAFAVTHGNPLHLSELGRWLRDRPSVTWPVKLPSNLDDLIELRLDELTQRTRKVLEAAAILGDGFRIRGGTDP